MQQPAHSLQVEKYLVASCACTTGKSLKRTSSPMAPTDKPPTCWLSHSIKITETREVSPLHEEQRHGRSNLWLCVCVQPIRSFSLALLPSWSTALSSHPSLSKTQTHVKHTLHEKQKSVLGLVDFLSLALWFLGRKQIMSREMWRFTWAHGPHDLGVVLAKLGDYGVI